MRTRLQEAREPAGSVMCTLNQQFSSLCVLLLTCSSDHDQTRQEAHRTHYLEASPSRSSRTTG